jgi:hypothetical protein
VGRQTFSALAVQVVEMRLGHALREPIKSLWHRTVFETDEAVTCLVSICALRSTFLSEADIPIA